MEQKSGRRRRLWGLGGRCDLGLVRGAPTSDGLRQTGSPTERMAPLQGDVGHLADDLGVNVSRGQQHFGCTVDAVGNVVVLWVHAGLGG